MACRGFSLIASESRYIAFIIHLEISFSFLFTPTQERAQELLYNLTLMREGTFRSPITHTI